MSLTRSTARNPPDRTGQRRPNADEVAWIGVADRLFPRADGVLADSTADVDKAYALFAHFIKKRRSELDIYFTAQVHAKAAEWGLTEDHARFVFYEGDAVMQYGKPTNMKVAKYKGQEIGL